MTYLDTGTASQSPPEAGKGAAELVADACLALVVVDGLATSREEAATGSSSDVLDGGGGGCGGGLAGSAAGEHVEQFVVSPCLVVVMIVLKL